MMITRLHSGNENTRPHSEHEDLQRQLGGFDANVADTFTQMAAEAWSSRASP